MPELLYVWRIVNVAPARTLLLLLSMGGAAPACAQVQLPGAVAPTEQGTTIRPAGPPAQRAPAAPPRAANEDGLLGRTLVLNGRSGVLQFTREGKDIRLSKVSLPGEKISRPSETCVIDALTPATLSAAGRPNGVARYTVAFPDCPFELDVFEGAVLVLPRSSACEFKAADCRVDPAGLWGQPANEIGAARTKEIEKARPPAEQSVRDQFHTWIEQAGKDRALVSKVSRDQAGFSSTRAEVCARYARESEHGYCSLVLTQARAVALGARVALPDPPPDATAASKKPRAR